MSDEDSKLNQAARIVSEARRGVALTGAGISTESGIPDFRSPGGLWDQFNPVSAGTLSRFEASPEAFYQMALEVGPTLLSARPNAAHKALVKLERRGHLTGIITQNIDNLHQRAGSRSVAEIHGSIMECTCTRCQILFPVDVLVEKALVKKEIPPRCDECGGLLKPNVVLFGEGLPPAAVDRAERWVRECDVFLVAGSSLTVSPVNMLPVLAKNHGARVIILNLEPTPVDRVADVVVLGKLGTILPRLVAQVESFSTARAGT